MNVASLVELHVSDDMEVKLSPVRIPRSIFNTTLAYGNNKLMHRFPTGVDN
jgi:hypothetical protein